MLTRRDLLRALLAAGAAAPAAKLAQALPVIQAKEYPPYQRKFIYSKFVLTQEMIEASQEQVQSNYGQPDFLVLDPATYAALQKDLGAWYSSVHRRNYP